MDSQGAIRISYHAGSADLLKYTTDMANVAVGDPISLPGLQLSPPSPNPSRGSRAQIHFRLGEPDLVELRLYDAAGRLVSRREPQRFPAGSTSVVWEASNLAPGFYFLRMRTASGLTAEQRWVLLP
jgi:hypothetical protein